MTERWHRAKAIPTRLARTDARARPSQSWKNTTSARNGFFYALDRISGSFIAGKQYVDELNWTKGLDPKTGRPLDYDPAGNVQYYVKDSHGTRARPLSNRLCPSLPGGKNWEPSAYNPELGLLFVPTIEGCARIRTVEQKDMEDQGGTVKFRNYFSGGASEWPDRLYGSLKAIDPATGETKVAAKRTNPLGGALATAGNLVFLGHLDGTFSAYDAKTLEEVWSFHAGSGIMAPPVSYAVNGKQYIAVLVGSHQLEGITQNWPELKNTSMASMLYAFSL
jgi:alcohol dehydrogenase (cytochrome c)